MGSNKSEAPKPKTIDPTAQAQANVQAQLAALPQAAELQFDILKNPTYGLQAQTQLAEDVRGQVFGQEQAVREALTGGVLEQLLSPTGITPQQQQAVDLRRGQAQDEVTEALRTRANLGGGLFGGRAQNTEQRAVQDLQAQFSEEDIAREERQRLNNQQIAMSIMGVLFPNVGLQQPQFINPVVGANQQYAGAVQQAGQTANLQSQQQAQQAQLQSSLFQALGGAAGGAFQGAGTAAGGYLGRA